MVLGTLGAVITIGDYLNQQVTLSSYHSTDFQGDVSYNADVSLNARVSYRQKLVYNQTGDTVASFCHVSVEEDIQYKDLITMEDGVKRVPLAIRHARNRDGTLHHTGVDL